MLPHRSEILHASSTRLAHLVRQCFELDLDSAEALRRVDKQRECLDVSLPPRDTLAAGRFWCRFRHDWNSCFAGVNKGRPKRTDQKISFNPICTTRGSAAEV